MTILSGTHSATPGLGWTVAQRRESTRDPVFAARHRPAAPGRGGGSAPGGRGAGLGKSGCHLAGSRARQEASASSWGGGGSRASEAGRNQARAGLASSRQHLATRDAGARLEGAGGRLSHSACRWPRLAADPREIRRLPGPGSPSPAVVACLPVCQTAGSSSPRKDASPPPLGQLPQKDQSPPGEKNHF